MYKLKDVAEILGVSDRTVERYLKSYFSMEKGAYQVSEKMLEVLRSEYLESESDMVVEEFTKRNIWSSEAFNRISFFKRTCRISFKTS